MVQPQSWYYVSCQRCTVGALNMISDVLAWPIGPCTYHSFNSIVGLTIGMPRPLVLQGVYGSPLMGISSPQLVLAGVLIHRQTCIQLWHSSCLWHSCELV